MQFFIAASPFPKRTQLQEQADLQHCHCSSKQDRREAKLHKAELEGFGGVFSTGVEK
jgi:hypothetical protein